MAGNEKPRRTAYADKSEPRKAEWRKHPTGICGTPGCGRKHFTHDLCNRCWLRYRRAQELKAGYVDHGPEPAKDDIKRQAEDWRPTWTRTKTVRLKRLRQESAAVVAATAAKWGTTANNRASSIIVRRRIALADIANTLHGEPFLVVRETSEQVELHAYVVKNKPITMIVDAAMFTALCNIGWISREGEACNISERGKSFIIEGPPIVE